MPRARVATAPPANAKAPLDAPHRYIVSDGVDSDRCRSKTRPKAGEKSRERSRATRVLPLRVHVYVYSLSRRAMPRGELRSFAKLKGSVRVRSRPRDREMHPSVTLEKARDRNRVRGSPSRCSSLLCRLERTKRISPRGSLDDNSISIGSITPFSASHVGNY